jgi:lysozyme
LSQTVFDALVHFILNDGVSAFLGSTLLRNAKADDRVDTTVEFKLWNKAGGSVVGGLVRRRAAKDALLQCGSYGLNG